MPPTRTVDFFSQLDPTAARETYINWPNQVLRVIDDYRSHTTIPHGVQKDAIQNSWDARTNRRRGQGWSLRFDLVEDHRGHRFLAITDRGTTGLTGRVLQRHEYELDLPEEDRWGRFESLAFTHPPAEDTLGARGQGKFIFVGASSTRRVLYDTLRPDGVHRLGLRLIETTRSPVYSWEGEEARQKLAQYSPDLAPLTEVGTRVIIDSPEKELVEAIESGAFARHISETWWQIIERFDADLRVGTFGRSGRRIRRPPDLALPTSDTERYDVWYRERLRVDYFGQKYRVKRLHVVRDQRAPVAEDIRGVALHRGGMKVMSVQMHHAPREVSDAVYGYVEFERTLEDEMKRLESPTHYSFDLARGVGRKVKQLLEDELARFAREKLGVGGDPRTVERERHREAERRALYAINRAARELGITGRVGPGVGGGGNGRGGGIERPIHIDMPTPTFPREVRRVNYGESVRDIQAAAVNDTDATAEVRLSIYIFRGDTEVATLDSRDLQVEPHGRSDSIGPFSIMFSPDDHVPGEYVLRANLVCLEAAGHRKGDKLHQVTFKFWVEEDPPERGIFDDIEGLDYGEQSTIDAEPAHSDSGGYKFQYNISHPAKRKWDETEDDLYDYLFRLMARELIYIDLRSDEPKLFERDQLHEADKVARRSGEVLGELMYRFYS